MPPRFRVPVWMMGLCNLTYGLFGGFLIFAVPQLLADAGVSEARIAGITAVGLSPGFWAFLFSPTLDVRFSRRTYAVALGLLSAGMLVLTFLSLHTLALLEALITLGFFCAYLYQSALSGWLSTLTNAEEQKTLSIFITIGNIGGAGIMALACNQIVRRLSPLHAALTLAAMLLVPLLPIPLLPAPGPDRRLARESFGQFFLEVLSLLRRREILFTLLLFAAPCASFALTNFVGSRGGDYHAAPGFVGLVGGVGGAAGGILGCLLFRPLARLPLRPLYLGLGVLGACGTLAFVLFPHTPATYATLTVFENFCQSLALTIMTAVTFEIIGSSNPLAATIFCLIGSSSGLPLTYMLYVDSYGYSRAGMTGSLATDAACGIVGSLLFLPLVLRTRLAPPDAHTTHHPPHSR